MTDEGVRPLKPIVYIVDDDRQFLDMLQQGLSDFTSAIRVFDDPIFALPAVVETPPDLLLLDLVMPILDGYEFCRRIRRDNRTASLPVIMVTGLTDLEARLRGFEVGADDYIMKPFHIEELIARSKAVLRRVRGDVWGKIVATDVEIHLPTLEVYVRGSKVDLTPREFEILRVLASEPGRTFTREELTGMISRRNPDLPEDSNMIAMHVVNIRKKIEGDPENPRLIQTVRGYGYRFRGPERPAEKRRVIEDPLKHRADAG